jgi:DNA-directed RNA polymerase specialized sigma24 family protein
VAKKVIQEHQRRAAHVALDEKHLISVPAKEPDTSEQEYECFKGCLQRLPADNRELIESYYVKDKQKKIAHRKELAQRLGINTNALRVRARRIRATLEQCIESCLSRLN